MGSKVVLTLDKVDCWNNLLAELDLFVDSLLFGRYDGLFDVKLDMLEAELEFLYILTL